MRAERIELAKELDGLKLAAELEFEDIAQSKVVGGRERNGLQCGVVQIGIRWSKAPHGQPDGGSGTVEHLMRVPGAHHSGRQCRTISDVAAEREMAVGEDRPFQRKTGTHVGSRSVSGGCGSRNEGN